MSFMPWLSPDVEMWFELSAFAERTKEKGNFTMTKKPDPELIDKDNPEWTEEMFREAKPIQDFDPELLQAMGHYRDKKPKEQIGIQLDADVVAWLKSQERYNALVNDALRREMESRPQS